MRGASHSRPRPIAFKSWYELWVAPYGGAYGANWVGVSGWVCLGGCVKLCLGGCVKLVWVDQALFLVLKPKTKSDTVPPLYIDMGDIDRNPKPVDRDRLELPPVGITDLVNVDCPSLLRPIFDALWNASGHARCFQYDQNGTFRGVRSLARFKF